MIMSDVLSYEFSELPLVIANGIEAGLINGCAEIKFDRGGEWYVESVSLEGYQNISQEEREAGKRPWIYVAAPMELTDLIAARLENEWFDNVQDTVNEQLARNREAAADTRSEMRREL